MTVKRFTITQDFEEHHRQIRDNGHIIMGCFIEPQAEVIVDKLNELNNECVKLKNRLDEKDDLLSKQLQVSGNLHKIINDLEKICSKYNIKMEDVAETLEEYICLDNGEEL